PAREAASIHRQDGIESRAVTKCVIGVQIEVQDKQTGLHSGDATSDRTTRIGVRAPIAEIGFCGIEGGVIDFTQGNRGWWRGVRYESDPRGLKGISAWRGR